LANKRRKLVRTPVAVEKLASQKSAEIESRQDALQTIFSARLDIFYPWILPWFLKYRAFQQPRLFTTTMRFSALRDWAMALRGVPQQLGERPIRITNKPA